VTVDAVRVPRAYGRREADGMSVRFDVGGPARVTRLAIDTVGDGTPPWVLIADANTDFRTLKGVNVKPTENGTFLVSVEATDVRGCTAKATSPHAVTVVVGG